MLPPPADTVSTSTRGSAIGTPATSPPGSTSGSPSRSSPASALVPPMSIVSASSKPARRATAAAPTTPPAGPESASDAALRAPSSAVAHAARRRHHRRRRICRARAARSARRAQVARPRRSQVRLGDRRRRALVLADLGQHVGRAHDVDLRQCARRAHAASAARAMRSRVRVQQRDRRRLRRERAHARQRTFASAAAERREHAVRRDALVDGHASLEGHERRRMVARQIVERRAILAAQLEQVAWRLPWHRAPRARRCARAACWSPRSCRARGARPRWRRASTSGRQHAVALVGRRARHLRAPPPAPSASIDDEIGERAADVDPDRARAHRRISFSSSADL